MLVKKLTGTKCYINLEEGAQISGKIPDSTEYFLDEILHSLLNLILIIKRQDFNIVNQNVIETTISNKTCSYGGQGFDAEKILDIPYKNKTLLLDLLLY